ncbi:MAG: hypothetical protein ACLQIQ_13435 [Beijerinckiaceae bacterium]
MGAQRAYRIGCGVYGAPLMKFTLTYDGSLPASANKAKNQAKWDIRAKFHPQLKDLWANHPALSAFEIEGRYFPRSGGATLRQEHHLNPLGVKWGPTDPSSVYDLCESIEKHGAWFRPLVRESCALHCGLKIIFLRKERPGKIYQGGDIDGRIKTLLDALTMPQHVEQVLEKTPHDDPIYCLLEEDSLVSGLQVETERLLTTDDYPVDYARLIIEVDVRVRQAMIYNQSFLG